ncbi:AAA family ATPase, partial [Escherichia sp. SS-MK2]
MSLTRLLIRDFRNIETADLALSPGFNFLVGANGSGKTSVLSPCLSLVKPIAVSRSSPCNRPWRT